MHSTFNGYAPKWTSRMSSLMPLHKWKNLSKFVPGISLFIHINIQHTTSALVRLYSCKTLKPPVQLYWLPCHRSAVVSTQPYSTISYTNRAKFTAHRWQQISINKHVYFSFAHSFHIFIKKSMNYFNTNLFA